MSRALALDIRAMFPTIHLPYLVIFVFVVALGMVTGSVVPVWLIAALWIGSSGSASIDRDRLGVLQSTLGVSRRQAVTARYVTLAGIALIAVAAGVAVLAYWSHTQQDTASAAVLLAVVPAVTIIAGVTLTLRYVASPALQQVGLVVSALTIASIGGLPLATGRGTSTAALARSLWSGLLPVAVVLLVLAPTVLIVGRALAIRVYARATL